MPETLTDRAEGLRCRFQGCRTDREWGQISSELGELYGELMQRSTATGGPHGLAPSNPDHGRWRGEASEATTAYLAAAAAKSAALHRIGHLGCDGEEACGRAQVRIRAALALAGVAGAVDVERAPAGHLVARVDLREPGWMMTHLGDAARTLEKLRSVPRGSGAAAVIRAFGGGYLGRRTPAAADAPGGRRARHAAAVADHLGAELRRLGTEAEGDHGDE